MAIRVVVADEQSAQPVDKAAWAELGEAVLGALGVDGDPDAELNVLFVDEAAISQLNERFLNRQGPTDVLAFPIEGEQRTRTRSGPLARPRRRLRRRLHRRSEPPDIRPGGGTRAPAGSALPDGDPPILLGDIVICPAVAARNAPEHASSYDDEMALLVVHGILHLMGMDHVDAGEADEMEALEQELLGRRRPVAGPWS
ncbi:MAG: rRNA maturation RNase YbeY [Acidimicrobiales bacterium]